MNRKMFVGDAINHFLVWGADRLGDVVMTFPALKIIRGHCPNAHITFVTTDYANEVVKLSGLVDEIFEIRFRGGFRNFFRYRILRKAVRRGEFEYVFVFGKATRYEKKIGSPDRTVCSDLKSGHWAHAHARAAMATLQLGNLEAPGPQIDIGDDPVCDSLLCREGIDVKNERYIALHPGTNRTMRRLGLGGRSAKARIPRNWPLERFRELMSAVRKEYPDHKLVCVGAGREYEWLDRAFRTDGDRPPLNLCGKTPIRPLLHLLKHAKAVVCPDSGIMHFAAMVSTPVIALFGPSNEKYTGPLGVDGKTRILRAVSYEDASKDPECMNKITVQQVMESLRPYLADKIGA